jgi:hypothetical protein
MPRMACLDLLMLLAPRNVQALLSSCLEVVDGAQTSQETK